MPHDAAARQQEGATPPVASAATAVPESPRCGAGASPPAEVVALQERGVTLDPALWGRAAAMLRGLDGGPAVDAPWRGLAHEAQRARWCRDTWLTEGIDHEGDGEIYAATFTGPAAEERAREYAAWVSAPADPRGFCPRHGAPDPYDQCTRCVEAQFPREVERIKIAPGPPQKPNTVEPGHVWRCVGIEGELEVSGASPAGEGYVSLRRAGMRWADVSARPVDMLGLNEWTFVRHSR